MFNKSDYICSAVSVANSPNNKNLAEFVFVGRSNVGKSSLINAINNRKNLARTSQTPGKTRTINYYLIDEAFYFIDLPGYGYASNSKEVKDKFGGYIEEYLVKSKNIKAVFLLIDFLVGPTNDDIVMYSYLKSLDLKVEVVCTKVDKVRTTHRLKYLTNIKTKLSSQLIVTSTSTKQGITDLQLLIADYLK